MEEEVFGALKKCAVGFGASEVVEEFSMVDGELQLVKKKVTKKDIPPDIKAVKLLMEGSDTGGLSDEELEAEKERLLQMLKTENI